MDHECGGGDSREAAVRLPSKYSLQLCLVGFGPRKPRPANRNILINPFPWSRRIVDKGHRRFRGLFRAHFVTRHQHLDSFWFGADRGRPARRGAAQYQRQHSLRVSQYKLLRNHASHRHAEHVSAINSGSVENRRCVGCHQRDRIRSRWHITPSYAAVVEGQSEVPRRQKGPRPIPHLGWVSQSHDEQDRLTLALLIPINLGSLILDERHSGAPSQCSRSERQPQAELDLAFRKCGSESQRRAGCDRPASRRGRARSKPMYVERRERRATPDKTEERAYLIIYAGKICPVGEVKSFRREQKVSLLAQAMPPAQTSIEVDIVRTQARVARGSDGTFVGSVIIAVHLASSQQIE